jgi:predicted permease
MLTSLHHALRVLRKDPGFAAVAVGSLALGIGATAAMFTFADAVLLRPLPVREPDRVVAISAKAATSAPVANNTTISYPDYVDFRDRNRSFEGMVAASMSTLAFSPGQGTLPHIKLGQLVSGNFFRVLNVEPVLGRDFRPEEDQVEGRDAVVVLSHNFWVSQFGASRSVLGSQIRLNGIEFSVIGVAPESFTGVDTPAAVYVPLAMSPRLGQPNLLHDREAGFLSVRGRLKPGISLEQARTDIGIIAVGIEKLYPRTDGVRQIKVQTEFQLRVEQSPPTAAMMIMLALLAFSVLLVACANVAGLLLSRARSRSREMAVRLAIGATRGALVRQLLLESLLVAVAGGLAGMVVADAGAEFFSHMPFPSDLGFSIGAAVDRRALLFTLLVSLSSTVLFGLGPALQMTRPDLVPALKAGDADSGKRRFWGRNAMVAGQVALSLVLLVISAVLVEGFRYELSQGAGFRPDRLFLTSFDTQLARYSAEGTRQFYARLLERTRSAPGVRSAALTSSLPLWSWDTIGIVPEGYRLRPGEQTSTAFDYYVSDGYFSTLGVRVLQGRGFLESDRENSPQVAVVNDHLARRYWPAGNALGKRLHLSGATGPLVEIVGIAKAAKVFFISEPPADVVYLPFRQHPRSGLTLVTQSNAADAATLAPVLREVVRRLDPDMPVFDVRTMQDFFTQRAVKLPNMTVEIVAGMGLMGLLLAMAGLYGLVAYTVSRRTREIGIRVAIGADQRKVVGMVLGQGLRLGAIGVAAGLVVSVFACRALTSATWFLTFDRVNPLLFAAIALPLLIVTTLAAWAPARHASRIDPIRALRDE